MQKVRKLIIPAAGWGTRFLPFTKIVHKELLPILNRPAISYLVKEAFAAGIEEIYLVIAERKQEIYNFFNINEDLEKELMEQQKIELLKKVTRWNINDQIKVIIQEKQLGLGHAIATAAKEISDEPFAVILGDDLIKSDVPAIGQLIQKYEELQSTIIGVQDVPLKETAKYGVVKPTNESERNNKCFEIVDGVEKPKPEDAPSTKAIMGRYVFSPAFMKALCNLEYNGSEIQVVDAFEEILKKEKIYAMTFEGTRYDLGGPLGFVKANVDYALSHPMYKDDLEAFLKNKFVVELKK